MENRNWADVRKELAHLTMETVVKVCTILFAATWFVVIAGVAVGLGWMVHALEGGHLVADWVATGLKFMEGTLFVADAVALLWAVGKNLIKELRD